MSGYFDINDSLIMTLLQIYQNSHIKSYFLVTFPENSTRKSPPYASFIFQWWVKGVNLNAVWCTQHCNVTSSKIYLFQGSFEKKANDIFAISYLFLKRPNKLTNLMFSCWCNKKHFERFKQFFGFSVTVKLRLQTL